jgi:hypothetical protein
VAVALLTVPLAPLKLTLSCAAFVSKPKPLMVRLVALTARLAVLEVTTGVTVATWTAVPLLTPATLTEALRLPPVNPLRPVTVSCVALALLTVPLAAPLKLTLSFAAFVSKPKPLTVRLLAVAARLAVLAVTTGVTVAT